MQIKEGETSPPKRYNSGAMILAMENAGQLIEDEELRAQIKGSGIGTSATRDAIIAKAENQAKDRGAQLINDAKAEIEQEKQQAIREIRGQVAELSVKIAEKIIKQQLATDDKQMELINKILDDVAVSDKAAK